MNILSHKILHVGLLWAVASSYLTGHSHGADRDDPSAADPYLPQFVWDYGNGIDLKKGTVVRNAIYVGFQSPPDAGPPERLNLSIEVYKSPQEAKENYRSTDELPVAFRAKMDPATLIDFQVGELCSYRYTPRGVSLHFQRGPYVVMTNHHEKNHEGPALKQEREDWYARLKKLDEALQEWTLKDFEAMLKEHYPEHIPSVEAKKKEAEPHPWTKLSHDECLIFLKDPNVEGHDLAGFIYHLGKRNLGVDIEICQGFNGTGRKNEQSHRSVNRTSSKSITMTGLIVRHLNLK